MKILNSVLSFNDIYRYKKLCANILKYNDSNIPCTCHFVERNIIMDCRVFFSKEINELINHGEVAINEVPFYVANHIIEEVNVGDFVIIKFTLISKEPFEIVRYNLV